MEDTITNSVEPTAICQLESELIFKDEPKGDVEVESETGGGCFDVLDMVEEPFDEAPTNYFSSDEEEADKVYSNCDSSSESGSPKHRLEAAAADNHAADSRSVEPDDDVDMEEVFETIDGDPNDYEECYVAERPPSPPDNPLPRGWKQVYHESGATIFVQLETNVCSLSRPYFLGANSTKLHKLPTTPVPCLRYRFGQQNKTENVAEYAATFGSTTCEGNTDPSVVGRAVSDTNVTTCPASSPTSVNSVISDLNTATFHPNAAISAQNSAISDVSATTSDANAVTCSENPTISNENPSYSDINSCTLPVRLAMFARNVLNTTNALASDADLIECHTNVATSNPATTAVVINSVNSDSNPNSSPVHAVAPVESAITSGANAAILTQNSDTSDVNMTDVSVAICDPETADSNAEATIPDSNDHTYSVHSATNTESSETVNENTGFPVTKESDTNTVTSNEHMIISDKHVVTSANTSDKCGTMISTAESAVCTSPSMNDAIASSSSALPSAQNTIKAPSPTKDATASTSNAVAPNDDTSASPMDAETTSTHNDTIVANTAQGEEAQLLDYCKRLFKFKKIKYLKFRSWDVRRTYLRALRNERNRRRCPFSNNKFVSFPIEAKDDEGNVVATKKWIINPRGRSYVAILHEYLQQSKKTQPEYKFTEVDNARNPYAATVVVNGTEYGTGFGMSKKEAKFEAAKATLEVLLPKMMKYVLSICCDKTGNKKYEDCSDNEDDLQNVASAFDDIEITDPRVTELSLQTTEPKPYELLLNCLQKKGEQPDVKFDFQAESMESTMGVGENQVTVKCGNKREGKQLAAQAMLQLLHPHIKNWGSLLRLYGNYITNQYRQVSDDKDVEELKCKPANKELLDTLRRRMSSLADTVNEDIQVSSEQH